MEAHLDTGATEVDGVIKDISRGGVYLEAPVTLEVGQEIRISRPRLLATTTLRVERRYSGEDGRTGWGLSFVGQGPMPGTLSA